MAGTESPAAVPAVDRHFEKTHLHLSIQLHADSDLLCRSLYAPGRHSRRQPDLRRRFRIIVYCLFPRLPCIYQTTKTHIKMTYHTLSDGLTESSVKTFWPLWLSFLWICAVPFLSLYRVGPLPSFYLEAISLSGSLVLTLISAHKGLLNIRLPALSIGLFAMAVFWSLQARLMHSIYPGMSDITAWTFVILALGAWSVRGWVAAYGQERVVSIFAWSLLIGATIQAAIVWLQFKGWSNVEWLNGIIARSNGTVNGQLGQRNHLGHYLMWGLLAASYLWTARKMSNAAGFLFVLALTATLGLVNSRTILGYIAALFLITPLWFWRTRFQHKRALCIFLLTAILAAAFQFGMGSLLDLFGNIKYETAVERAGTSGFEGSMRQIEWSKAWIAFQSAPWFGHGWNSFAQQTFLINAQQQYFPNNILGVLFTHSHNIVMQLLSEMGIAGTLLATLTLLAAVWRLLGRNQTPASLFLLTAAAVSLCHSMLEYPLWYIYFLTVFSLILSLTPSYPKDVSDGPLSTQIRQWAGGIAALSILIGMANLSWEYRNLTQYSRVGKTDDPQTVQNKIDGLQQLSKESPMLAYYADLSLSRRADPTDAYIRPWAEEAALKALTYRPYSNAYQVGLYLYRQGKKEEGAQWMQAVQYYYPYMMYFYADKIRSHPVFAPLLPKLLSDCKDFINAPKHQTAKSCDKP